MGLLARRFLCSTCCAFALGLPLHILAQEQQKTASDQRQNVATTGNGLSASLAPAELPDSPGAEWAKSQADSPQQESSSQPAAQTTSQPQAPVTQDQKLQHPVGTAAAEAPKVSGITAAQPAGVAIAPAKQKRVRTIVIKVGAIIGAGAAIGAVIALSEATPSKPPGAH
jgi:hypothetical protein